MSLRPPPQTAPQGVGVSVDGAASSIGVLLILAFSRITRPSLYFCAQVDGGRPSGTSRREAHAHAGAVVTHLRGLVADEVLPADELVAHGAVEVGNRVEAGHERSVLSGLGRAPRAA